MLMYLRATAATLGALSVPSLSVLSLSVLSLVACGSPAKTPKKPDLPPLETSTLAGLAQGPGARWVVIVRPTALFAGELATALSKVAPAEGIDRLSTKLGLDVRRVPEALVVGFGASTFYAVRLPNGVSPAAPVDAFEQRVLPPIGKSSPRPDIVRTWGTLPAGARASAAGFWSTHGDVVVGEGGRLGPVLASIGLVTGKLAHARSLERQAPFDALSTWARAAPFAVMARCPLDDLLQGSSAGAAKSPIVAQECDGAALSVTSAPGGKLVLALHVAGRWGKDAANAEGEVRAALDSVQQSDLGRALGLRDAPAAEVKATAEAVDAVMTVDANELASGLHRLLAAELGDATK